MPTASPEDDWCLALGVPTVGVHQASVQEVVCSKILFFLS